MKTKKPKILETQKRIEKILSQRQFANYDPKTKQLKITLPKRSNRTNRRVKLPSVRLRRDHN